MKDNLTTLQQFADDLEMTTWAAILKNIDDNKPLWHIFVNHKELRDEIEASLKDNINIAIHGYDDTGLNDDGEIILRINQIILYFPQVPNKFNQNDWKPITYDDEYTYLVAHLQLTTGGYVAKYPSTNIGIDKTLDELQKEGIIFNNKYLVYDKDSDIYYVKIPFKRLQHKIQEYSGHLYSATDDIILTVNNTNISAKDLYNLLFPKLLQHMPLTSYRILTGIECNNKYAAEKQLKQLFIAIDKLIQRNVSNNNVSKKSSQKS